MPQSMTLPATVSLPSATEAPARPQILLVEDDPAVRRSLQLLLEGQGYGVRAFATAAALLADRKTQPHACLITDYRLNDQDGISMLRALRQAGWPGPAILMTAYRSPDVVAAAREAGFSQLFDKPLKPHLLIDAIGKMTTPDGSGART